MCKFFRDLAAILVGTDFVDEDFDPRFIDIVAAAVAVVHAQTGFDIAEQIFGTHERVDLGRDHRGAAHPATDEHTATQHTVLFDQFYTNVMQAHCGAVFRRCDYRDLELTRQITEFGVEG